MSNKKEVELKRTSKTFTTSVTDLDSIQEFLEEMALNGWILKSVSQTTYYFEKCEAKKVRYYIDFFNVEGNKKNPRYNYHGRKEYIQLCEEAGWNYVTNGNGLLFFYTEDMKLAPIREDDEEKFKGICKYFVLKNGGMPLCVLAIIALVVLAIDFVRNIIEGNLLYHILCDSDYVNVYIKYWWIYILFSGSASVVKFILFYKKNKNLVSQGDRIQYLNKKEIKILAKVRLVVTLAWISILLINACISDMYFGLFMYVIVVSLGALGVYMFVREKKNFGHINSQKDLLKDNIRELLLILTMSSIIFFGIMGHRYNHDILFPKSPNLTITDLGVDLGKYTDIYDYDNSKVTLFSNTKKFDIEYYENGDDGDYGFCLNYAVITSKYKIALDTYKHNKLNKFSSGTLKASEKDVNKWNAKEVYYFDNKEDHGIMVVYEDKIIYVISDCEEKIDFTGKYVEVITEKLNK